ncbi:MAG TPA: SDR family oxidoreductase [Polyangiaceae bacterium]|nr:SDR family oxidoreductase [Polyangiaceae bacterium]
MSKLAGKVAIVTGGSRGIGLAIARGLGVEGARVAIASRTARELEAARVKLAGEGIETLARVTDVARYEDVSALVAEVTRQWGRIDVLVNNAGINGAIGRLDECDLAEWKRAIEVNLFGTMHACRAVLPAMRAQRSGKIVNLAGGGVGGPGVAPRVSAYATSKAAVVQFTESLARELVEDGIQMNAIAPGAVVTEMTAAVVAAGPEKAGKELYERTLKQRESGGEPPELAANLVVWLASDASGALTGKMLSAKWDKVATIDVPSANKSSLFALRRIDGALFDEIRKG